MYKDEIRGVFELKTPGTSINHVMQLAKECGFRLLVFNGDIYERRSNDMWQETNTRIADYEIGNDEDIEHPTENLYRKFILRTHHGEELLNRYSLKAEGLWVVEGEDPNCDLGGHHSCPVLGYFQGRLDDVIRKAVNLPKFWGWGYGGSITLLDVIEVPDGDKE
jgi:hypothetical protein